MPARTTILMLTENFYPLNTASAQRAFAYAKTLASHSCRAIVLTKSAVNSKSDNIIVISTKVRRDIPIFNPILMFLYCLESVKVFREHRVSLILATIPKINNAVAGFLLSKLFRVPLIIDIRDCWETIFSSYPFKAFIPKLVTSSIEKITSLIYQNAASIVTVNETLRNLLIRKEVSPNRIHIIPNGVDTSLFRPCEDELCVKRIRDKHGLPPSKLIFVYAGALSLDYRFGSMLNGVQYTNRNKDMLLLIIAHPTRLVTNEKILGIVERLGLEAVVKVLGPLPVNKLAELLRCCDVGIIPLDDNRILKHVITAKIFAYIASALPVLASGPADGELEKFINTYKVGVFVGNASPMSFAKGFSSFLRKKSDAKVMGRRGREIMTKYYDRYNLSLAILDVIEETMKG